jgi:murein DD-endopeptidase / murein LD-carboxypeptidase
MDAERVVGAARSCVGARFRPHGRSKAFGFDCIGVAALAYGIEAPHDYVLRSGDILAAKRRLAAAGFRETAIERAGPGMLVLTRSAIGQLHLCILTANGFVHADAKLRRVIETPGCPGGIVAAWILEER